MKLHSLLAVLLAFVCAFADRTAAQGTVNVQAPYNNPSYLIQSVLDSSNAYISNVTFTGHINQLGYFSDTTGVFPLSDGIVLSNGGAANLMPGGSIPNFYSAAGDADMMQLALSIDPAVTAIWDEAIIEFDVTPTGDTLELEFVYGSEEYQTWSSMSYYIDPVGIFVSGPGISGPYSNGASNIALVPGTTTGVAASTISPGVNSSYYVANSNDSIFDLYGYSLALNARIAVQPCQQYHIKFAVADANDQSVPSALMLGAGSFSAGSNTTVYDTLNFCNGDSVQHNGVWYTQATVAMDTLPGGSACDSIAVTQIVELPAYSTFDTLWTCFGDSILFDSVWYHTPTTLVDSNTAANGCDSSTNTIIAFYPSGVFNISSAICEGDSLSFNGSWLYDAGTYLDSTTSSNGCDSIVVLDLTVNPSYNLEQTISVCAGDSAWVLGMWGFPGNVLSMNTTTTQGCDSIVTVEITSDLGYTFEALNAIPDTVCAGDTLVLGGGLTGQLSCINANTDTLLLPDLIATTFTSTINVTCPAPDSVLTDASQIVGVCLNMEHSYAGDLEIILTCPNGQSVDLMSWPSAIGNTFLGEPNDWDQGPGFPGVPYTYCFGEGAPAGTWMDNANVYFQSYTDLYGNSYTNQAYLPAGAYAPQQSFDSLVGCPIYGDWTINFEDYLAIDNGYLMDWALIFEDSTYQDTTGMPLWYSGSWEGENVIDTGSVSTLAIPSSPGLQNYTFEVMSNLGCNYDTTISVQVLPAGTDFDTLTICSGDSVEIGGSWYSTDTIVSSTVIWPAGCSLTEITSVVRLFGLSDSTDINICSGDSLQLDGTWYGESQVVADTSVNPGNGCIDTMWVNLIVTDLIPVNETYTICAGDSVQIDNVWYSGPAMFSDTIDASTGCDTLQSTTVTVLPTGNAGADSMLIICNYDVAWLPNYLAGADTGGVFMEPTPTSALNGNSFDANTVVIGGTYTVWYVVGGTLCPDTASINLYIDNCIGIEEISKSIVRVYPNPNSGSFVLEAERLQGAEVRVTLRDIAGRMIEQRRLSATSGTVTTQLHTSLAAGTYLVMVESEQVVQTVRIVVQ